MGNPHSHQLIRKEVHIVYRDCPCCSGKHEANYYHTTQQSILETKDTTKPSKERVDQLGVYSGTDHQSSRMNEQSRSYQEDWG